MKDLLDNLDANERVLIEDLAPDEPRPVDPARKGKHGAMLATLTHEPFSDPDWIYERKLDGERCIALRLGDDMRLLSRNGQLLNDTYPELAEALSAEDCEDFVVDGEVVAFDGRRTSFRRLQQRMQTRPGKDDTTPRAAVFLYLFDIPCLLGRDCRELPLRTRKELLRRALSFADPLRFTVHRNGRGVDLLKQACAKGWEGLIAKRAHSP